MRIFIYPALWLVTATILLLQWTGIGLEWTASRLVPTQKFLSKTISERHG